MDPIFSTPKRGFPPPDFESNPEEENEISDDDDDRNHKHRRREAQSQSLGRDALEHVLTRPFKKRKTPSHPYNSQSSEMYKSYNISSTERDNFTNFGKRRHGIVPPFSRAPLDLNQRIRANELLSGGRGGWELGSWAPHHDSKYGLTADFSSQMVQPSLFSGRGMQNVSNTPWSRFGLNNGINDTLSLVRPPINPPINISTTQQRCRDFEEQGFCLRGDMCPMEHGINWIVVEDVQSLSQFNLPVSLPSANLVGPPAGPLPLPSITGSSTTIMNTTYKSLHTKISNSGASDNFMGSVVTTESDLYDPDQPLWANDSSKTSNAALSLNLSKDDVTESLLGAEPSDDHVGIFDGSDFERPVKSTNISPWGRSGSSRNISETREKPDPIINVDETGSQFTNTPLKTQSNTSCMVRRPSQRAQRTLFVRGIPEEMNKKETLLLHFKKFGQVSDIYIPSNTDRAFVQFCKREEAEAALRSADAVMGNRFIKLWWANRDNKPEGSGSTTVNAVQSQPLVSDKRKDSVQSASTRGSFVNSSVSVPASGLVIKDSKAAAASQKKVESLESLKEEIRKKQEMLDRKRNDFRLKLEKLQKQSIVVKGEVAASKQEAPKVRREAEETSSTTGPVAVVALSPNTKSAKNLVASSSNTNENVSFKQLIRSPLATTTSHIMNKFKLDNRPTTFKIIPPLPTGLADVSVLKEHFSTFGDLSSVDLEDLESNDESAPSKIMPRISFTRRRSAELAFLKGKSWKGHNLHFMWLETSSKENPSSSSKGSSDTNNSIQPALEFGCKVTKKDSVSGGESENLEKMGIVVGPEFVEPDEDLQSSSTAISSQKHSP